jgi:multisubunit Na+/H+ antiporter MnhE subunit
MRYIGVFVLWLALSRSVDGTMLALGALLAIFSVALTQRLVSREAARHGPLWARVAGGIAFAAVLAVRFVVSTAVTSAMILTGREEGSVVVLSTRLRDPGRRFLLLNAITLTPSTISLYLEGDLLYVHWLRRRGREVSPDQVKEALERPLLLGEAGDDARGN